jgi:transcriptional regulator with XRE-family HTH domain
MSIANRQLSLPKRQVPKPQAVETIGDRIGQARREYGVTAKRDIPPAELARMVKVSKSTITRAEAGERQPSEDLIRRIAAALNVTPAWLRYGVAEVPRLSMREVSLRDVDDDRGHTGDAKGT